MSRISRVKAWPCAGQRIYRLRDYDMRRWSEDSWDRASVAFVSKKEKICGIIKYVIPPPSSLFSLEINNLLISKIEREREETNRSKNLETLIIVNVCP